MTKRHRGGARPPFPRASIVPALAILAPALAGVPFTGATAAAQEPPPAPEAPRDSVCPCPPAALFERWQGAFSGDTIRGPRIVIPALERVFMAPAPGRFGVRLHDLNDDLGGYFGRTEGALVLEVRDDAAIDLRAGDVITAIDGREVEDSAHAARILQSYRPGEELVVEVWRQGRAVRVEATTP